MNAATKQDKLLEVFVLGIKAISVLLVIVLLAAVAPSPISSVLHFTWRWPMVISLIIIILLIAQLVVLGRPKNRSHTTLWLSLQIFCDIILIGGYLMAGLSTSPQMYIFWGGLTFSGALLVGITYFFFVLSYINKEEVIYRFGVVLTLIAPALLVIYSGLLKPEISQNFSYMATPVSSGGFARFLIMAWIYTPIVIGVCLLFRQLLRTKRQSIHYKQTRLLLMAMVAPLFISTVGQFIPGVRQLTSVSLSLAVFTQVSIMAYAIMRYDLFRINPTILADTILGTMNEAVITINADLGVERLNQAAAKFLGANSLGAEGKRLAALFGQDAATIITSRLNEDKTDAHELQLHRNGQNIPISLLSSRITYSDDSTAGYILVFRDISKEFAIKSEIEHQVVERTQQVHEEQRKLKASIEALNIGFIMMDTNDDAILSNDAVGEILGKSSEHWTLPSLAGRFKGEFDLEAACREARLSKQKQYIQKVNAGDKILRIFLAPVEYRKDAIGLVIIFEDITEEEIMKRSKDEFFSITSHELRTPLTAIRGNASMIMQFYEKQLDDPEFHGMVYDIHESSTRLIDIVNDFLDVSRLEQNKVSFDYAAVALDKVIENVIYETHTILNEKHLSMEYNRKTLDKIPKVWADKNRLKQVIYNLLGNAIKFTEKGGIDIDAVVEGNFVKVTITDTGRGISQDGQKLLFHKFQQAGSSILTRDTTRGTGLGLYISKMMVEVMGGQIVLESSKEGKGSTFSFTVPISSATVAQDEKTNRVLVDSSTGLSVPDAIDTVATLLVAPSVKGDAPEMLSSNKLLIVEDDPYVVRLYQRIFSGSDLEVQTALNGKLGIEVAKKFQPSIILMDVMMPVMNGLDALKELKSDSKTKHIPVIMLSSFGEEDAMKEALASGAISYLIKSDFTPEQILEQVEKKLQATKPSK